MKRPFRITGSFRRDVKRSQKRGKNLEAMWRVVELLSAGESLSSATRVHRLSGNWTDHWECHIESDWLLIWRELEDALELVRLGTHADIFE